MKPMALMTGKQVVCLHVIAYCNDRSISLLYTAKCIEQVSTAIRNEKHDPPIQTLWKKRHVPNKNGYGFHFQI